MKILFFANTDWYLYNFRLPLAKALRQKGHEVVLVSPPGEYAPRIREAGFQWISFDFSRTGMNPVLEVATLVRLVKLYRDTKVDLAHHFTIKCVLYGGIAARICHVPATINAVTGLGHVFTTNSMRNLLLRPFVRLLYRVALKQTRVIFQNTDDLAAFINLRLVDPLKCHVVRGSGIDTAAFQPTERSAASEQITVVMIARLLNEKGVREYVAAAKIVRQQFATVQFLLAGETDPGNPSSIPTAQIAAWTSDGDVSFLGHITNVAPLLASADIAVLPSYREGTPRSLLEAAASGLPLVATDVPGCREIVKDRKNGFLVPPYDVNALAEAIGVLVTDSVLRTEFGKCSREIAESEFSEELVFAETERIYAMAHNL